MKFPLVLLASISLCMSSMLTAQETGSLIRPAPGQIPDSLGNRKDAARQAMYNYTECAVRRSRPRVESFLATFPGSKEARQKVDRLAVDECLSDGELHFSESIIRGGAYETLYRIDYRNKPPADLNGVPPIDYSAGATTSVVRDPSQMVALRQFADCVVRSDTANAHTLIISRAGSLKEAQTFDALAPRFEGCLPKGITLKFSKAVLRGLIGETLYLLTKSAGSTSESRGG